MTRLADVARAEMAASEYTMRAMLDDNPAVQMIIFQQPNANSLQISDDVRKVMEEIKQDMPDGVDYGIKSDPTQFVRDSINAVIKTLLEAIALVVVIV